VFGRQKSLEGLTKEDLDAVKRQTAGLSVFSNTALVLMKLAVGFAIGSVSIISEAIHSGMDLIAAAIAFVAVRRSSRPPDDCHAFGHGKYEAFSGLIEALLIFVAAALIVREAVGTLLGDGVETLSPNLLIAGIAVMGISAVINWLVSSRLMAVAKKTESIALESDAWHLRTDVYTSLGVLAGLVLIRLTGIVALDAFVAIGVALVIVRAAVDLTRRSLADLTDRRLTDEEEERVRRIICEHASSYAGFHKLRTRRSGPDVHIDFHLVVARGVPVEQAHDLTDHLESDLRLEFPRSTISIHIEPCDEICSECASFCLAAKESREQAGR
jgi:cation diffusion facilitator family transporter